MNSKNKATEVEINRENTSLNFEEEYKKILQITREIVLIMRDDKIVFFNKSLERVSSYTKEELTNIDIKKLIQKEDLETLLHNYNESSYNEYIKPYQFKMYGKNNKTIWVEISSSEIIWYGQKSILCFLMDVTKRREYELALYESEKRKSLLINSMKDLVFVIDSNFKLKEIYNYKDSIDTNDIINKQIDEINFPIMNINKIRKAFLKIKDTKQAKHIEYALRKDNQVQWYHAAISLIEDPFGVDTEFLFVVRNITKLKKAEKRIRDLSYIDPLSGAYNRRYILEKSGNILNSKFSLVLIDLDYFKKINDNFGHLTGDYILKEFSKFVNNFVDKKTIFSRYGGEEFLLILPGLNKEEAFERINNLLKSLNEYSFVFEDQIIKISFSAGVSDSDEITTQKKSLHLLIESADKKLYFAKNNGRNRVVY